MTTRGLRWFLLKAALLLSFLLSPLTSPSCAPSALLPPVFLWLSLSHLSNLYSPSFASLVRLGSPPPSVLDHFDLLTLSFSLCLFYHSLPFSLILSRALLQSFSYLGRASHGGRYRRNRKKKRERKRDEGCPKMTKGKWHYALHAAKLHSSKRLQLRLISMEKNEYMSQNFAQPWPFDEAYFSTTNKRHRYRRRRRKRRQRETHIRT